MEKSVKKVTLFVIFICFLSALFYSYDLFIRVAPSVMTSGLESSLGIGATSLGFLSAAYFYAYVIFQIPAGIVLDKYDCKWVISGAMFICMLGNLLFSIAPNYEVAILGRVLMGVGSAFGFIGAAKIAAMWLPQRFFSGFMGFTSFIGIMGGLVADTVLESFVQHLGWREGNNIFTYIGVGIFILMFLFIKDSADYKEARQGKNKQTLMYQLKLLMVILKKYQFWVAGFIGAVLFIPINVLASLWGIGFIGTKLHISEIRASELNALLFIGSAVGFIIVSFISVYTNRFRLMLVVSGCLMTAISVALIYMPMPIWLFTILIFCLGVSVGPELLVFEIGKFLSPKGATATSVSGINMLNNLLGAILLPLFGWILVSFAISEHHLEIHAYHYAMAMLPIMTLICIPLCMLLPKRISRR
ncbi:MFS transporter [Francisellaceae bacterium]|nr:MFS transporter [Francisellaceae bacterium]